MHEPVGKKALILMWAPVIKKAPVIMVTGYWFDPRQSCKPVSGRIHMFLSDPDPGCN